MSAKLNLLLSTIFIFLLSSFLHFAYDFSKKSVFVGIFTPINESIWEHLKLAMYSTTLWYIIYYFINIKNNKIPLDILLAQCTISILISITTIVCFYYTYTGALGINSGILNIFSLVLGTILGQYFVIYHLKNNSISSAAPYLIIYTLLVILFTIFTFLPPKIPLFKDPINNTYGIQ